MKPFGRTVRNLRSEVRDPKPKTTGQGDVDARRRFYTFPVGVKTRQRAAARQTLSLEPTMCKKSQTVSHNDDRMSLTLSH